MKKFIASFFAVVLLFCAALNLSASNDFEESGKFLKDLSIIKGNENGDLKPYSNLTREESIVILLRMLKKEEEALKVPMESVFNDIPKGYWASKYISYAKKNGLTNGIGDNKFGIRKNVTTKELVSFMLKSLNYSADWASEDVMDKAQKLGLLKGVKSDADKAITRGNVFIIMKNTLNTKVKGTEKTLITRFKNDNSKKKTDNSKLSDNVNLNIAKVDKKSVEKAFINIRNSNVEIVQDENISEAVVDYNGQNYAFEEEYSGKEAQLLITGKIEIEAPVQPKAGEEVVPSKPESNPDKITKSVKELPLAKIRVPKKNWKEIELSISNSKVQISKDFKSDNFVLSLSDSLIDIKIGKYSTDAVELYLLNSKVEISSEEGFENAVFSIESDGKVTLPKNYDAKKSRKSFPVKLVISEDSEISFK